MMIKTEIQLEGGPGCDDLPLKSLWLKTAPAKGDFIWFTSCDWNDLREQGLPSSFEVVAVAHWVTSSWSPSTHTGDPIHSLCVVVRPTTAEAPQ